MNLIKFIKTYQADIILAITVVLISITAFNLGKISAYQQKKTPITITEPVSSKHLTENRGENTQNSRLETKNYKLETASVVASKASKSKVYHFSWCPGAYRITAINRISFNTAEEAEKAGYTLAGNCHP